MSGNFKHAVLRRPAANFAKGQTSVDLGAPVFRKVEEQFELYGSALERCGLRLTILDADPDHPDSTFVEDTAVLTRQSAILTRPGTASRVREVEGIRGSLERHFKKFCQITAPGTLDGGDICETENHFFIGISRRTNDIGARQLAGLLADEGYTATFVDIRSMDNILHLKSGIAYIGDNRMVVMEEMALRKEFAGYELVCVGKSESYAANCVRVNGTVLMPAGFPALHSELARLGCSVVPLPMSEFQKMDGGLSCLSLRF